MSKTTMNETLLNVMLSTITMLVVVQSISLNETEFGHYISTTSKAEKANRGKKCFVEIPVPDNNGNEVSYITEQDLQKEGEMCYVKNDLLATGGYEKNLCPCDDGLKCIKLDTDKDTEPDGICISSLDIPLSDSTSLPTVSMSTDTTLTTDISISATELSADLPSVTAPINVDLSTVIGLPDATTVLSNDSNLLPSVNKETGDTLQLNNKEMKSNKGMLRFDSHKPTELPNLNGDKDEIIDQSQEDQMDELMKYALKIMSEDTSEYKCDANALEKWMQLM